MPRPLVILVDATPLCRKIDGVGRYTRELIDQFADSFPNYTIILIGFLDDSLEAPDLLDHPNIRFVKLPFIRKIYSFLYSRFVRIPVNWLVPHSDLFISTNFTRFPYITNRPSLIAVHDLAYIRYPETIERRNLKYLGKHVPLTIRESSAVIATSEFAKREMEELFPDHSEIFTVSNGINLKAWHPAPSKRNDYILAVGTLEPRKNLGTLLQAYNLLPLPIQKKHPLIIVGKKGWGETQTEENEHISYTGYVDDRRLLNLYQQATLFVSPSLYEGFGLPLLEALSTSTPVACSDIPPFRDIARNHAVYFNPNSATDIKDILLDTLSKKVTAVQKSEIDKYSWRNSAGSLDAAIRAVLGE